MAQFIIGKTYSRRQIHDVVGGELQTYLPTRDGKVVAVCVNRKHNRGAPEVILPGFPPKVRRNAEIYHQQGTAVPLFIKERSNAWRYAGDYQVHERSVDPDVIADQAAKSCRSIDTVSQVLFLIRRDRS